jgi:hypothetical protein
LRYWIGYSPHVASIAWWHGLVVMLYMVRAVVLVRVAARSARPEGPHVRRACRSGRLDQLQPYSATVHNDRNSGCYRRSRAPHDESDADDDRTVGKSAWWTNSTPRARQAESRLTTKRLSARATASDLDRRHVERAMGTDPYYQLGNQRKPALSGPDLRQRQPVRDPY